mgnify:FL=1
MTFSPDGQRICFLGRHEDKTLDVVVVPVGDSTSGLKVVAGRVPVYPDFAWHPGGDRVCFTMKHPELGRFQIYGFDPDSDDPPTLLAGQDPEQHNRDSCCTPDGTQLIHVAVEKRRAQFCTAETKH